MEVLRNAVILSFLIFKALVKSDLHQSRPMYNHLSSFSLEKTWPDLTVRSLQVYGSAVAVDKNNNVVVLHRGTSINQTNNDSRNIIREDVVMIISSKTGKIVGTWGSHKFVKPHGIEVAGESLFITDVKLHQVFKFQHDPVSGLWKNNAVIVLGESFVPGNGHYHFCSPTDVAVLTHTGDFFVADGYCNSRIVKFNKDGFYLDEFGAGTSSYPVSLNGGFIDFNVTHSITIAQPATQNLPNTSFSPLIFVADRNNGRVQSFLENGTFVYEISYEKFWETKEMLLSVAFSASKNFISSDEPLGTLYSVVGHLPRGESKIFEIIAGPTEYHFKSSFSFTEIENNSSVNKTSIVNGSLRIETPHDIAVSEDGNTLYVIEVFPNLIVKKFIKSKTNFAKSNSTFGSCSKDNLIIVIMMMAIAWFYGYIIISD